MGRHHKLSADVYTYLQERKQTLFSPRCHETGPSSVGLDIESPINDRKSCVFCQVEVYQV